MTMYEDAEIERSDIVEASREGADTLFLVLAAIDPAVVGVEYNHVARKLAQTDDVSRIPSMGGDFMANLWEGNLAEALYHADTTNMRLIIRTLSRDVILSALAADRGSMESAERWFKPNEERYGWSQEDFE